MKYTRLSSKIGSFFYGVFCAFIILILLGCFAMFVYLDFMMDTPIFSIMCLTFLPGLGFAINWLIGYFFSDEHYDTGLVSNGRTVYDIVKTPKYYSRRMFVCFIECFLFLLLVIRSTTLMTESVAWAIFGILGGLGGIVVYFIVGMSSYEQSSLKLKREEKNIKDA